MAVSGYTPTYKDTISGTMGGTAGSVAPSLSQATGDTKKTLAWNAYYGQKALMDWAKAQDKNKRQFDYSRATGDLRSSLDFGLQGLGLQDLTAQYDLSELRQMIGTARFQQIIADALRSQGMA